MFIFSQRSALKIHRAKAFFSLLITSYREHSFKGIPLHRRPCRTCASAACSPFAESKCRRGFCRPARRSLQPANTSINILSQTYKFNLIEFEIDLELHLLLHRLLLLLVLFLIVSRLSIVNLKGKWR